jgi:hypothetical protein
MLAFFNVGIRRTYDRPIIAFRAAACKINFVAVAIQRRGYLLPRAVNGFLGLAPESVLTVGVAEDLAKIGRHSLERLF